VRLGPVTGNVVRTDPPAASRPSTTNDDVAGSKAAASPAAANGRTEPAGFSVTAGEMAALAGEIVGGGLSAGLAEHPADPSRQATAVTATTTL
jgi:hypothetical protein